MPEGWVKKRLGDIAQIVSGGTPSRDVPAFWGGAIPWVTPTDITRTTGRILDCTADTITTAGLAASSAVLLPVGTILMTSRATVGECRIAGIAVSTNQGFKCLVPGSGLDGPFLYYQLLQNREHLKRFGVGSTFLEVSKKDTENFRVWLPESLREQRRIVEYLSSLDDAIERSQELILKYQQVRTGLMHDLFTRGLDANGQLRPPQHEAPELYKDSPLGCVPCDWDLGCVRDFGTVQLGRQRSPDQHSGKWTTAYLRVANVFDGYIDYSDVLRMDFNPHERNVFSLRQGDILLNEGQSLELVGRSALYEGPNDNYCFQNTLVRFRVGSGQLPSFWRGLFKWWLDTGRFTRVAKQTTSVAHLGADRFARMVAPVPEPKEQNLIAERLKRLETLLSTEERLRQKLHFMKIGLMNDLLSGVMHDRLCEPAHV